MRPGGWEWEQVRAALQRRAWKGRRPEEIRETRHPVRTTPMNEIHMRDNALFHDQTDDAIVGFAVIGTFTT